MNAAEITNASELVTYLYENIGWVIVLIIGLFVLYKYFKNKKTKSKLPDFPEVKQENKATLDELQREFGGTEQVFNGDIVNMAEQQISELNQRMKNDMLAFNKQLRTSKEKIEKEERRIVDEGQKLLKRKRLLEKTRNQLNRRILMTNAKGGQNE